MGTEGGKTRYEFNLYEKVGDELDDVVMARGGPERIIRALIDAAELVAQEHGITINWPNSTVVEGDVSADEFKAMMGDPAQRQIMESMFGGDMLAGLDKMANFAALIEGQQKKPKQS